MMLLKKFSLTIGLVLLINISVYASYGWEYVNIGKIIEEEAYIMWGKSYPLNALVYIDSNYLEIVYYYPFRDMVELMGGNVVWNEEEGDIRVIYKGKEYYVYLEELAQKPVRGKLSIWKVNEGKSEYIALNNGEEEGYYNYLINNNQVFISLRPDLINLLDEFGYTGEISNEYHSEYLKNFRKFIESMGLPDIWIYSNPLLEEIKLIFKKEELPSTTPPLIIKGDYYVPVEEILELAGVQIDWIKDDSNTGGYYVFRGNQDIPPLAYYAVMNNFWELLLYDEADSDYLNAKSYFWNQEAYEQLIYPKRLLDCRQYFHNDILYMELDDMEYILNYFGNYKIFADKDNKTVHMERKGLKTP